MSSATYVRIKSQQAQAVRPLYQPSVSVTFQIRHIKHTIPLDVTSIRVLDIGIHTRTQAAL